MFLYVLSQVLVVASDLMFIASVLRKKKQGVVFYLILSTILFASHYLCLRAWTGAVIGLVELVFLILMYALERAGKTKYNTFLSVGTIVVTIVLSLITWESWLSILPMSAMVVYLLAMMCSNLVIVKTGTFVRLVLNGVYMFLLGSYFGSALTLAILAFNIVGIVQDAKRGKQDKVLSQETT